MALLSSQDGQCNHIHHLQHEKHIDKYVVYSEEECACLCRSGDREILKSDQISLLQCNFRNRFMLKAQDRIALF